MKQDLPFPRTVCTLPLMSACRAVQGELTWMLRYLINPEHVSARTLDMLFQM